MYALIDGNSIGYAAQGTRPLTVDGVEVQSVFQSLKTLRALKSNKRGCSKFIWFWDGKAQFRLDMYPEYKGNRDKDPKLAEMRQKYKDVQHLLKKALTHLGITQVVAPEYEADDLAGLFVRMANKSNSESLLITGDGDWQQLVSGLTTWHDPRKSPGKYCTRATFKDVTGVDTATQFLEIKAIQGDSSDHISGVGGLGPKAAIAIINNYGSVKNLLEVYKRDGEFTSESLPSDLRHFKKKLNTFCRENIKLFTRNYRLMNLQTDERDEDIKKNMQVTPGKKDMKAFKELCHELQFHSILREFDRWNDLF